MKTVLEILNTSAQPHSSSRFFIPGSLDGILDPEVPFKPLENSTASPPSSQVSPPPLSGLRRRMFGLGR